ncbi:unnamed protein product, partial [Rotaria sp. Silwood1]
KMNEQQEEVSGMDIDIGQGASTTIVSTEMQKKPMK